MLLLDYLCQNLSEQLLGSLLRHVDIKLYSSVNRNNLAAAF